MSINLNLLPVYYAQEDAEWLLGRTPYSHQRQICELISQAMDKGEFLCVFNTSATGGGKTLASFAYSIRNQTPALGIYPTNELIEDQLRALEPEFTSAPAYFLKKVDSRELDRWGYELDKQGHSTTLETILSWQGVVLTNPDIVYLTFFGLYSPAENLPGINQRLQAKISSFPIFVFDEFHLYNVKQLGNVATLVGILNTLQKDTAKVFLFTSATPNPTFLDTLIKLGISVEEVNALEVQPVVPRCRCVSHPVELSILPANLAGWEVCVTLEDNFHLIQDFIHDYPQAKSVFILDGVTDTIRLANFLRNKFGEDKVGEVHGMSSQEERKRALFCQHTVGTATIEVGIDFKAEIEKDLLVFEAKTAAQFIQRLGRLGRHLKQTNIPNRTIALVPVYVYNFINEKLKSIPDLAQPVRHGATTIIPHRELKVCITRAELNLLINEAYKTPNQFLGYFRRYTPVEAFDLRKFIGHQFHPDLKQKIEESIDRVIETMSSRQTEKIARSHAWLKGHKMLKPLQSFRGIGFEVALIDQRETIGIPIKTYDLFFVLRRTRFKELSMKEFFRKVDEIERLYPEEVGCLRRQLNLVNQDIDQLLGMYGYFQVKEILDKSRKVWFEVYQNKVESTEKIITLNGLTIATDPYCDLYWLNQTIKKKTFVCWVSNQSPWVLNFSRGLPPLFEVYGLKVKGPGGGVSKASWSIVFNQNAYFLDCLR